MGMKDNITKKFNALPPEKRQKVLIGTVLGGALVILSTVVILTDDSGKTKKAKAPGKEDNVSNLLMGTGGREIGLAGVSNDVTELKRQLKELQDKQGKTATSEGGAPTSPADPDAALDKLSSQVAQERETLGPPGTVFNPDRPRAPAEIRLPAPNTPAQPNLQAPAPAYSPPPPPVLTPPTINTTRSEEPLLSLAKRKLKNVYLPTGSIMSGVLLTGLDAPTGRTAQSAPIPVVVRIKHEAILPSRYRSEVQEAFILAAGFGDLSSERAYLRAERFSMILRNGEVIDLPIKMSAVGNDGKSGLRGRLVSKQGAVIGQALLAGLADGVSRAFSGRGSSMTGSNDLPSTDELVTGGIGGGASGALDRVAAYFLSQAESMYPVIEVDASREVSFVLLEGLELVPRTSEDPKAAQAPAKAVASTAK